LRRTRLVFGSAKIGIAFISPKKSESLSGFFSTPLLQLNLLYEDIITNAKKAVDVKTTRYRNSSFQLNPWLILLPT
ncbi:hypothetical protein, partial [Niastella populi]|uniref:hypothetical protein n=1 Tax=Niastella populi TaxID=550983 RepID=UPI001A981434